MTKSQNYDGDVRDNLAFKLARLTTLGDRIGQKLISQELGISLREFRTLGTIAYLGTPNASLIARESFLDHAQVSRMITGLISKGLVARVGTSGRGGVLRLTQDGEAMMARGVPFTQQLNAQFAGGIAEKDQAHLMALIDQVLEHAQTLYRDVNGDIADLVPQDDAVAAG